MDVKYTMYIGVTLYPELIVKETNLTRKIKFENGINWAINISDFCIELQIIPRYNKYINIDLFI